MMKFGAIIDCNCHGRCYGTFSGCLRQRICRHMLKSATGRANEKNNTEIYDSNRVYPYRGPADNKGNVRRHMTDGMDDTRRAAGDIGRDIKRGAKDAVEDTGRAAGEIGRDIKRGAKDTMDDVKKDMNRTKQDIKDNMMNE